MTTSAVENTDRERRLGAILAAYLEACDAGQSPDRQGLLEQHPELALDLAAYFVFHDQFQDAVAQLATVDDEDAADSSPPTGPPELERTAEFSGTPAPGADRAETGEFGNRGAGGGNGDGNDGAGAGGPDLPRGERVHYFGDYELLRVLGRGGMGVVYKARQQSLNRMVAVKMIRAGHWASDDEVRRFRNEAEAVANLDHPQIVTIHEVGEHQGRHYFSMKLVDGPSLADVLARYAADPRAAAVLLTETARAVHHAHQRGILHRDLKPSNIVLDAEGHPHVTDFGLAKRIEGESDLSVSGAIIGTPSYMSPEQAAERRGAITTAADVYGLGAVLYATLTGRPPFAGESVVATLEQVRERPPEQPRGLNPRVDRDLETICLKCLEKDPRRRYDSAAALADDLERWLRGEPILARRSGTWERVLKWSRRRPAAAALVGVSGLAALTLVGLAVALAYQSRLQRAYTEVDRQRGIAEVERGIAETALAGERTFLYQNRVIFAERELGDNTPHRADVLLDECPPDHRRWEWNYLKRQCHAELMTISAHRDAIMSLAVSNDGRWIATGPRGVEPIRIWDAQTGREVRSLPRHVGSTSCAFSPDGTRLASVGGALNVSDRLLVREVATGRTLLSLPLNTGYYASVAFSPDGQSVAVASGEKNPTGWLKVVDAATGAERVSITTAEESIKTPHFSPDGTTLIAVVGSSNPIKVATRVNEARVWDATTGQQRLALREHSKPLMFACYSPDGRTIATAGYDPLVRLYSASDGVERRALRGHRSCVNQIDFSPDSRRLVSASDDGSAKIWDVVTGGEPITLRGHRGGIYTAAFHPAGRRLFTSDYEGIVKVWDSTSRPEALTFSGSGALVYSLAFSPDGRRLVSASGDRLLRVWEVPSGRLLATWTGHNEAVWNVAFSPDGTRVASAGGDWQTTDRAGEVLLWDAATGQVLHALRAHQGIAWSVAFRPDGQRLVSGGGELRTPGQEIVFWDVTTGTRLRSISGLEAGVGRVAYSPDGRRIAAAVGKVILSWDAESGVQPVRYQEHPAPIISFVYTPDGRRLISVGDTGIVRVWDVAGGRSLFNLHGDKFLVNGVAIHPDGTRFASVGTDQTVKLWDITTGQQLLGLRGHDEFIGSAAFSPDGRFLATSDGAGQIKLWNGSPLVAGAR